MLSRWVRIWNAFSSGNEFLDPLLLQAATDSPAHWYRSEIRNGLETLPPQDRLHFFGTVNVVIVYFLLRCQAWLPWFFPKVMTTPMTPDLAADAGVQVCYHHDVASLCR